MLIKIRRDERAQDSFHHFVNKGDKGGRASADWRSEIQACFQKTTEDFLDTKFQNMLQNKDSPLTIVSCSLQLVSATPCNTFRIYSPQISKTSRQDSPSKQQKSQRISYKNRKEHLISAFSPFQQLFLELKKSSETTFFTHKHTYVMLFAN